MTDSGSEDLILSIRELISESGFITFEKFMSEALYGEGGYYSGSNQVWGKSGDYVTNTDISDVFAIMMAKCFFEMWQNLNSPSEFTLLEAGAGRGTLTLSILESIKAKSVDNVEFESFLNSLSVIFIDRGKALEDASNKIESILNKPTKIYKDIGDVEVSFVGVIYSNELFDAMPVHIIERDSVLKEICVQWDDSEGSFKEVKKDLSDSRLKTFFEDSGIEIPEGYRCEVNLHMEGFVKEASKLIESGYLLTVDYGYPRKVLYDPMRSEGTLLCHYRHKLNDNPYINVGSQDITTHIDFTALANFGTDKGLDLLGFTTQSNFLLGLGVTEEFGNINPMVKVGDVSQKDIDIVARNQSIKELVLPGGVGDTFKVMVQGRLLNNKKPLSCFSFKDLQHKLMC